ncbi:MAG: hypothetical protein HKN92_09500 [Chitinophagales bacterium]|nr:hypothetical protein [Chitinophagales bacterium]
MSLGVIIAIILIGLLLIVVELFVIPGTTIFGLLGVAAVISGIVIAYSELGNQTATIILGVTSIASIVVVLLGFKAVQSDKVSVNSAITSKMNVLEEGLVEVGDKGIAYTTLRPNGKGLINDIKIEVYSQGSFIDKDTEITVTKVTSDKIFVKPINQNT